MSIFVQRPVNPVVFGSLRQGDLIPARIDYDYIKHRFYAVPNDGSSLIEVNGAGPDNIGQDGVLQFVDSEFQFISSTDVALRVEARGSLARATADEALARSTSIRQRYPIRLVDEASPIVTLAAIKSARYDVYRTKFATSEVGGTIGPVAEAELAIAAWGHTVASCLPFEYKIIEGVNAFRGGNNNGLAHISVVQAYRIGRLIRNPGDLLCRRIMSLRFWGYSERLVDCPLCIAIGERIIA